MRISSSVRRGLRYAKFAASQSLTRSLPFMQSLAGKDPNRPAKGEISGERPASITFRTVSANFGSRAIGKKIRRAERKKWIHL